MPPIEKRKKNINYSFLDERGIVKKYMNNKSVYVEKGDVIIGKTLTKSNKNGEEEVFDYSYVINHGEEGYIDRVVETVTPNGYKMIKVIIRNQKIPEIGDKFACFKEGVCEVMTTKGWKLIENITLSDKVAILENDNVVYETPLETHCYDYSGKIYELKSQQIELSVTPNHRMFIKKRFGSGSKYKDTFEFQNAEKCFGKRLKYKKNINNYIPEKWIGETFVIPSYKDQKEIKVNIEDWIQFFGIWIAEGWANDSCVSFAANKKRVQNVLDIIATNMNFTINKTIETNDKNINNDGSIIQKGNCKWIIYNKQLASYMKEFSVGSTNKFLPDWVWNLNKKQSKMLLFSLELGDGYTSKTNNRFYYTSSKKLCDDITRLALHAGYSSHCRVPDGRKAGTESYMRDGRLITSSEDNWVITIIKTKIEPEINHGHKNTQNGQSEQWIEYNGKVYCLSVRTGIFLCRQNGKPVWSGNSRSAQKGTCGLILPQEDMPFTQDGQTPDILINSLCIPSRMTISQILETVLGKACCMEGTFGDSTPFSSNSTNIAEQICERLKYHGFQRQGWETMYNGMTGEPLEAQIFMGTVFYQRLKHMVSDKVRNFIFFCF
jgi:hypothetical protein